MQAQEDQLQSFDHQQQHQEDSMPLSQKIDNPMDGGFRDVTAELKKSKRNRSKVRPNDL